MAIERDDPYTNFSFVVEIDGFDDPAAPSGSFSEVSGIDIETQVLEYRSGADQHTRLVPVGNTEPVSITLRRGVTGSQLLFEWFDQARSGSLGARRSVRISLLNESREPAMQWSLRNAFPVRLRTPALSAIAAEIAIEELELRATRIELVD